jgi:integrase
VAERRTAEGRLRRNFRSRTAAQAWLTTTARGQASGSRLTLTAWLDEWLLAPGRGIEPRTVDGYRWAGRRWQASQLARKELAKITPDDIEVQLDQWLGEGLTRTSLGHLRTVLGTALNRAVRQKRLAHSPVPAVNLPGRAQPNRVRQITLGLHVSKALSDAWARHPYRAAFELLLHTGLRPAELCALTWADLRIAAGEISVRRAVKSAQVDAGRVRFYVGEPKTASSSRNLSLDPSLRPILFAWRDRQRKPEPIAWVFPSPTNREEPMRPDHLSKVFRRLVDDARISVKPGTDRSELRLYDLRALHATLLLANGVDPVTVAARLGHTDIVSTMRRYAGYISEADRRAAGQGAIWERRPLPIEKGRR